MLQPVLSLKAANATGIVILGATFIKVDDDQPKSEENDDQGRWENENVDDDQQEEDDSLSEEYVNLLDFRIFWTPNFLDPKFFWP